MPVPTRLAIVLLLAALLSACATTPKTPTQTLEERAQARWQLLIAGDVGGAYQYLSPGYRTMNSRDAYAARLGRRQVQWLDAKVESTNCPEGEAYCDVIVALTYEVRSTLPRVGRMGTTSQLVERWIQDGGQWFHLPTGPGL
jgi:hypothetical protein